MGAVRASRNVGRYSSRMDDLRNRCQDADGAASNERCEQTCWRSRCRTLGCVNAARPAAGAACPPTSSCPGPTVSIFATACQRGARTHQPGREAIEVFLARKNTQRLASAPARSSDSAHSGNMQARTRAPHDGSRLHGTQDDSVGHQGPALRNVSIAPRRSRPRRTCLQRMHVFSTSPSEMQLLASASSSCHATGM